MEALAQYETRPLATWNLFRQFHGLVRIGTVADGSCFLHAVFQAFYIPYLSGKVDKTPFDRMTFIDFFRKRLAIKMEQTYAKELTEYMESRMPLDYRFFSLVSQEVDKDIYILNVSKHDLEFFSMDNYKGRKSIVLLYFGNDTDEVEGENNVEGEHFEILAQQLKNSDGTIDLKSEFDSSDELVSVLWARLSYLKINSKSNS